MLIPSEHGGIKVASVRVPRPERVLARYPRPPIGGGGLSGGTGTIRRSGAQHRRNGRKAFAAGKHGRNTRLLVWRVNCFPVARLAAVRGTWSLLTRQHADAAALLVFLLISSLHHRGGAPPSG